MLAVFAVHVLFGPRFRSLYALYMLLACSACVPAGGLLTPDPTTLHGSPFAALRCECFFLLLPSEVPAKGILLPFVPAVRCSVPA